MAGNGLRYFEFIRKVTSLLRPLPLPRGAPFPLQLLHFRGVWWQGRKRLDLVKKVSWGSLIPRTETETCISESNRSVAKIPALPLGPPPRNGGQCRSPGETRACRASLLEAPWWVCKAPKKGGVIGPLGSLEPKHWDLCLSKVPKPGARPQRGVPPPSRSVVSQGLWSMGH